MATFRTLLTKRLSYRDMTGAPQSSHLDHWKEFRWQAGPWITVCFGPWGDVKVWASSVEEGKRVIRHAGAIAGVNPDDEGTCSWYSKLVNSTRLGRTGLMGVQVKQGSIRVSKRVGSSGAPFSNPV